MTSASTGWPSKVPCQLFYSWRILQNTNDFLFFSLIDFFKSSFFCFYSLGKKIKYSQRWILYSMVLACAVCVNVCVFIMNLLLLLLYSGSKFSDFSAGPWGESHMNPHESTNKNLFANVVLGFLLFEPLLVHPRLWGRRNFWRRI